MNNSTFIKLTLFVVTLLLSSKVLAHFPTLSCQTKAGDKSTLHCLAGYSDASLASEAKLNVYSYDEELLSTLTTATDGTVSFAMPKGEFYIVFDPGHESPAEFDYAELE